MSFKLRNRENLRDLEEKLIEATPPVDMLISESRSFGLKLTKSEENQLVQSLERV